LIYNDQKVFHALKKVNKVNCKEPNGKSRNERTTDASRLENPATFLQPINAVPKELTVYEEKI